jgi:hypothetical protein
MANSWGESGTTWGQGDWGQQNVTTLYPSGYSITAALGDAASYPEQGWGSDTWGVENWGQTGLTIPVTGYSITASLGDLAYAAALDGWGRLEWDENDWGTDSLTVIPTGLSITGSLGTMVAASEQGWGRATWGNEPWGDSYSPTVGVTGLLATGYLGTLAYSQSIEGWGRDEWGYGNWGENTTTVRIDGLEMSGEMGPDGWGEISWGNSTWGGKPFVMNHLVADIQGVTGYSITGSLGTPTPNYDFIFTLSESLLGTLSRGSISINDGADHTQGLGTQLITGTLNSSGVDVADVVFGPSSFLATMSLGAAATGEIQRVAVTGYSITGSLGTLDTIDDMQIGLSGQAITGSLGTLASITDMQIGLTGYLITGSLGSSGVSPLGYKDIDITGYTSYTDVEVA